MNRKSFKIARKPGQGDGPSVTPIAQAAEGRVRARKPALMATPSSGIGLSPTTRKTIEVPEDFFRRVKIRAVERGILEKELWAEILSEYFMAHPTA